MSTRLCPYDYELIRKPPNICYRDVNEQNLENVHNKLVIRSERQYIKGRIESYNIYTVTVKPYNTSF